MTTFHARFKAIMKHYNLSGVKCATLFGVSQAYISEQSNGVKEPTATIYEAIAKNFPDVDMRWVITGVGEMFADSKTITAVPIAEVSLVANEVSEPTQLYGPISEPPTIDYSGISSLTHGAFRVSSSEHEVPGIGDAIVVARWVTLQEATPGGRVVIVTKAGYRYGRLGFTAGGDVLIAHMTIQRRTVIRVAVVEKIIGDFVT